MNEPFCQSYWDWVNMARSEVWRVISVAVKEDDLDGVLLVAGPLGAFCEKLKYHMALPRNTVSGSDSSLFLASSSYFMLPAYLQHCRVHERDVPC